MKNVWITIDTKQKYHMGGEDAMEFATDGGYNFDENTAEFSYIENPLAGLDGTKTTFTVSPGSVAMHREGAINSRMIFEEGTQHRFLYETPVGSATLGIDTQLIRTTLGESGGELEIIYTTDIEHSIIARNRFLITIREQKER